MPSAVRLALAASVVFAACSAATADGLQDVIDAALPKTVKLYGAGGFRGLEGYGSGFLVSPDGHVATSWGPLLDADPLTVVLDDGRRFDAKLVGADPGLGVAVLKIDGAAGLPHFDLAAAADALPGDRVLGLSNMFRVAAGDEPVSVIHGMILAKTPLAARRGRFEVTIDSPVYVIDAVTNNPGAAGGALVTLDGRLAGLIGRELQGQGSETWVNYAIPAVAFRDRVAAIVSGTDAPPQPRPDGPVAGPRRRPVDIGLVMVPDVTARTPAYVADVIDGTPAAAAGFAAEDLVLFVGDSAVRSIRDFADALSRAEKGMPVPVIVRRGGRLETVRLTVAE